MSPRAAPSLRRRLMVQLLVLSAVLAVALYVAVRLGAERASEATLDGILGAATTTIAEELRSVEGGAELDLSPGTFSMLAAMGEERIFHRIDIRGLPVTGYDDLPLPPTTPTALEPAFYDATYRDADLRLAAVARSLMIENRAAPVLVIVGQTREGQRAIARDLGNRAAALGLVVFLVAVPLSLFATGTLLRPIGRLAEAVGRRGGHDLRPVRHPAPAELMPLVEQLNAFIARLRQTLAQTETFIAEAAHHIRTPLATLRSEAELALRQAGDEPTRARLRGMIRATEESARSANQLLDHATVLFRADQRAQDRVELGAMVSALADRFRPTADLKEMEITLDLPAAPMETTGDAVLIESALRNLIDNALKYSPAESRILITLREDEGFARLDVNDRGRGLGGETQAALSKRFRRGGNVGGVVGSGLGLTIVSETAAAMGGRFALKDRKDGGTCATLWFPFSS
ncbi:sensor histidine kinase [Pararhodobacter zhoushanensis]|uniref:sensor histidine kinase n=1 Tax=Pararhodobacter zhoushanensis TaxID=2479545 RepID=UPI000F8E3670|nr:sensor histidine kinase [Pararhodobacter zhoushanensis]